MLYEYYDVLVDSIHGTHSGIVETRETDESATLQESHLADLRSFHTWFAGYVLNQPD